MYIPFKKVIKPTIHSNMKINMVAENESELQIQIEKSEWDDLFFDLNIEDAVKLQKGLDEFIAGRK